MLWKCYGLPIKLQMSAFAALKEGKNELRAIVTAIRTKCLREHSQLADQCLPLRSANSGHNDVSGGIATAGERGVSLSGCFLSDRQRSTGSDCTSHDCL
jgi:hypothetical protein